MSTVVSTCFITCVWSLAPVAVMVTSRVTGSTAVFQTKTGDSIFSYPTRSYRTLRKAPGLSSLLRSSLNSLSSKGPRDFIWEILVSWVTSESFSEEEKELILHLHYRKTIEALHHTVLEPDSIFLISAGHTFPVMHRRDMLVQQNVVQNLCDSRLNVCWTSPSDSYDWHTLKHVCICCHLFLLCSSTRHSPHCQMSGGGPGPARDYWAAIQLVDASQLL